MVLLENLIIAGKIKSPQPFCSEILDDPYAKAIATPTTWTYRFLACRRTLFQSTLPYSESSFDWQAIKNPGLPFEDLIIYEMHVRGFTKTLQATANIQALISGIVEKIPYLKTMGINAVEFMPLFEFNECENPLTNPKTGKQPLLCGDILRSIFSLL